MATSDECFRAMGAMIFSFQGLEQELKKLFVTLSEAKSNEVAQILISSLDFKQLLDAIGAMVQHKGFPAEMVTGTKEIIKLAAHASEQRNRYVHSHYELMGWDTSGEVSYEQTNHKISRRTGIKWDFSQFDPTKLDTLSSDITKVSILVFELHDEMGSHLHPDWQGKPSE